MDEGAPGAASLEGNRAAWTSAFQRCLPFDPVIAFPGSHHLMKLAIKIHDDVCAQISIASLFKMGNYLNVRYQELGEINFVMAVLYNTSSLLKVVFLKRDLFCLVES